MRALLAVVSLGEEAAEGSWTAAGLQRGAVGTAGRAWSGGDGVSGGVRVGERRTTGTTGWAAWALGPRGRVGISFRGLRGG